MEDLKRLRAEIDGIDAELARLFAQRMAAAAEIAAVKREQGLPVRDPAREREVLALAAARIADPALAPRFAAVMEALMAQSRAYQEELGAISVGTSITSSARRGGGPASRPMEGCLPIRTPVRTTQKPSIFHKNLLANLCKLCYNIITRFAFCRRFFYA